MPDAIDNDVFFGGPPLTGAWPPRGSVASVPDVVFYGDAWARPPAEAPLVVTAARTPLRFGAILVALGWLGILIQRSPLRQLVVGAPVFEEFAKFGLALAVLAILGARSVVTRLPYAWLSGLGFGVLEHFLSYPSEAWIDLALRASFHAASCGLSMAVYSAIEPHPDVRVRWGSTLASSLLHWANNFGAVALAILSGIVPGTDKASLLWSITLSATAVVGTFAVMANAERVRVAVARETARLLPALGVTDASTGPDPRDSAASLPPPGPPPAPPPPEGP